MMDEDGIGGSGLREDQLVTLDEMDAVIRQASVVVTSEMISHEMCTT